jgi:hypothetical protein
MLASVVGLLALAPSPEAPGPVAERVPKVLLLGLDGVRPDALALAHTPHLDALAAAGGFSADAFAGDVTVSGPGWASILTGVWRDKHRIDDNTFAQPDVTTWPDLFTRLRAARPGSTAVSLVSWPPLHQHIVTGADVAQTFALERDGDAQVAREAARVLSGEGALDPDVLFVYFGDIDKVGHTFGFHPAVPEYVAEIESVDGQVGALLEALRCRPGFEREDWLVLVTTDHGGSITGSHGRNIPEHRRVFFLVSGRSVARGPLLPPPSHVDVAPTVLAHLGVALDPAWGLDGRPRGLSDERPPPEAALGRNLVVNGGAEADRGFAGAVPDAHATGWRDPGTLTVVRWGSPGFPSVLDPGPPERGHNLFAGGHGGDAWMTQLVDVTALAEPIDRGEVDFELEGYLGGEALEEGAATLTLLLLSEALPSAARLAADLGRTPPLDPPGEADALGSAALGPVTAVERGGVTGLLLRRAHGPVPPGTRWLRVTLTVTASGSGRATAFADELSVILRRRGADATEPAQGAEAHSGERIGRPRSSR